jgi:RNA polymerase sigma-70 factor (ECF subfamily)
MSPSSTFPSAEECLSLHLRLCEPDPVAPADLCQACLGPLVHWLETQFPWADPHLRETAAHDALLAYVQAPQRYQPERGPLPAYLRMAARRDLYNLMKREERHHRRRVAWSAVELREEAGNIPGREEDPSRLLADREESERWEAVLRAVRQACTEGERRVLELMLAGGRGTAACALALGLTGLPVAEQEREVKRAKDRIMKRLEREGARHE